jgi:cytochrome c oxidase subunit 4
MSSHAPDLRSYLLAYLALLIGVGVTVAAAYLPLAGWALAIAMTIATAKAAVVMLIFMHVRYSPRMTWIVVAAGLVWLGILIVLSLSDYATRTRIEPGPHTRSAASLETLPVPQHSPAQPRIESNSAVER